MPQLIVWYSMVCLCVGVLTDIMLRDELLSATAGWRRQIKYSDSKLKMVFTLCQYACMQLMSCVLPKCVHVDESRPDWNWIRSMA